MKMKHYVYAIPTVLGLWFLFHFLFDSFIVPNPIDTFYYIVHNFHHCFCIFWSSSQTNWLGAHLLSWNRCNHWGVDGNRFGNRKNAGTARLSLYLIESGVFTDYLIAFWSGGPVEDYLDYCSFYFLYHDPGPRCGEEYSQMNISS